MCSTAKLLDISARMRPELRQRANNTGRGRRRCTLATNIRLIKPLPGSARKFVERGADAKTDFMIGK
jgi:hypothetical protein